MFWEGQFTDGRQFELKLEYGTVILIVQKDEFSIGRVSDFPDVTDVISIFKNWVATDPEDLK